MLATRPRSFVRCSSLLTLLLAALAAPAGAQDLSTFTLEDLRANTGDPTTSGFAAANYTVGMDGTLDIPLSSNNHFVLLSPSNVVNDSDDVFQIGVAIDDLADDDYIGWVFGFDSGDSTPTMGSNPLNNGADYVLVHWKAAAQGTPTDFGGPLSNLVADNGGGVSGGMYAARIGGIPSFDEFWYRKEDAATPGTYTNIATATGAGAMDYRGFTNTCAFLRYSQGNITIYAQGEKVLETTTGAPFPAGKWGLYFAAQDRVTLRVGNSICFGDNDFDGVVDLDDDDDDNDGILDTVESGGLSVEDANTNDLPDFADNTQPGFVDTNSDNIDDRYDFDLDGLPNHLDLDSDGDGVSDLIEGNDADGDGQNDANVDDTDLDGRIDTIVDLDTNGVDDAYDSDAASTPDADMDGDDDYLDADDDNDGTDTSLECSTPGSCEDDDNDGVPNYLDTCGDTIVSTGEGCDDGNETNGDGCTSACLAEDGEACDANGDCDSGDCDVGGDDVCLACVDDDGGNGTDTGCGGANDFCDEDVLGNACVECIDDAGGNGQDSGCGVDEPFCVTAGLNGCVECVDPGQCDDGNECTSDSCGGNACGNVSVAEGTPCMTGVCDGAAMNPACVECVDDGDCLGADAHCDTDTNTCEQCVNDADCNDSNVCTTDVCNANTCSNTNNVAACNDGDACTENDTCGGGSCAGTALDCDDSNVCTDDSCNAGACVNSNNTESCDDGDLCTTSDVCAGGACGGAAVDCGDGLACTADACDDGDGSCDTTVTVGCAIDNACWTDGQVNPDNACETCDEGASTTLWTLANGCEPCTMDADCMDPDEPVCDTGSGTCVECDSGKTALCTGESPICDTDSKSCVGCASDVQCDGLGADVPACDTDTGACFLCTAENDLACVGDLTACDDGAHECVECTDSDVSACVDAEVGEACVNFECGCTGNGDCGGDQRCNTESNTCFDVDSDGDGVNDEDDADSDNDGITDEDEGGGVDPAADADNDNIPNYGDPDFDGFVDADDNDVDDRVDADGDGVPNHLDLDSDNDGIADVVENAGTTDADTDNDGRLDSALDADGDGLVSAADADDADAGNTTSTFGARNTDEAGGIDSLDLDADADGIPDIVEALGTDADFDGVVDSFADGNGNGWGSAVDAGDGGTAWETPDTDGDDKLDFQDDDSDDDGISDAIEGHDGDGDGEADITPSGDDENGNGLDDAYETGNGPALPNTDNDGFANYRDDDDDNDGTPTASETGDDNRNGVPDYLEGPVVPMDGSVPDATPDAAPPTTGGGLAGGALCAAHAPAGDNVGYLPLGLGFIALAFAARRRRRR